MQSLRLICVAGCCRVLQCVHVCVPVCCSVYIWVMQALLHMSMLSCFEVCCRLLQCVAAIQSPYIGDAVASCDCVVACCRVWQGVAVWHIVYLCAMQSLRVSVLQCVALCCSVLRQILLFTESVAVCCSVLQHVSIVVADLAFQRVCCSTLKFIASVG